MIAFVRVTAFVQEESDDDDDDSSLQNTPSMDSRGSRASSEARAEQAPEPSKPSSHAAVVSEASKDTVRESTVLTIMLTSWHRSFTLHLCTAPHSLQLCCLVD